MYNSAHDIVRTLTIVPDRAWGGEGALGFNIGFGYLHRLPAVASKDVVFDSEVPAQLQTAFELSQPEVKPPPQAEERKSTEMTRPVHGRRRASHSHTGKKVVGIEDILREGQEKSEKEDFVQVVSSPNIPLPPPPKRHSPVEHQ